MSKVAVVFWSGTGNTEAMADAVAAGARGKGAAAGAVLACDSVTCQNAPDDSAAAACRAMGEALA